MAAWGKRLSRITTMSWNELSTRVRQEFSKRLDLAMYRVGMRPGGDRLCEPTEVERKFFFSTGDLPQLAALLQENLGSEVSKILQEADEICAHRFRLLGYEALDYGQEIDWHLDAVHGKRAPLKPWFKIQFLDFEEVGDHKVTWELNRHQHLMTLAKAWHFADEGCRKKYVTEIVAQWDSWQRANPYPMGINWGSSLEVAFRSLSWIWVDQLLANCESVSSQFRAGLVDGLGLNARYIERHLSTYFSPNTHLLGEAVALFFIGTLYPQIPGAERWQRKGWQIAMDEAGRQVRPDGVYFEQALYYHVYALDFFLHLRRLGAVNGLGIPVEFDRVIEKMGEVVETLSQVGPIGFGDDDGGRLFDPRRNRAEHLADPLALCALTFGRDDFKKAAYLTEEAVWLFGRSAMTLRRGAAPVSGELKSRVFPDGGIYVMADAESRSQLIVDAGPQGTGHAGHGHADALSVSLSVDGRPWLMDSGSYCYISENDQRNAFRGTAAHNTLLVDGQDQAIPEGPFSWKSVPTVRAEDWIQGESFSLFVGSHDGYERLPAPVIHRRLVFHLHGGFWLVRDLALGRGSHQVETFWHFAPEVVVTKAETGFVSERSAPASGNGGGSRLQLALLAAASSEWNREVRSGYVSPAYGSKQQAAVVRMSASAELPWQSAVLLVPLHAGETSGNFAGMPIAAQSGVHGYIYDRGEGLRFWLFTGEGARWHVGSWSSDASLLLCRTRDRRLEQLILCQGSSVELDGQSILEYPAGVDWLEWTDRGGKTQVDASDEDAVQAFCRSRVELGAAVF
jgi:Heparinase II/III-like protein/Heparinase II/III N-terminus